MIEDIRHLFHSKDHKEIMLGGLLILSIAIYVVLALIALSMGLDDIFWVKLTVALMITGLFLVYLKFKNISLIAILFIIIVEIDTSLAMISKELYEFVTVYPFFIIFGFFFFFRLKTALWMSLVHFLYWGALVIVRYNEMSKHPMFQSVVPDINMFTTSVVVVFLGKKIGSGDNQ
jgi:hypothetical protein